MGTLSEDRSVSVPHPNYSWSTLITGWPWTSHVGEDPRKRKQDFEGRQEAVSLVKERRYKARRTELTWMTMWMGSKHPIFDSNLQPKMSMDDHHFEQERMRFTRVRIMRKAQKDDEVLVRCSHCASAWLQSLMKLCHAVIRVVIACSRIYFRTSLLLSTLCPMFS